MEARDAIAKLKKDLAAVRDGGRKTVRIEALEDYLAKLEQDADNSFESQKLELQRSLAHYDATNKSSLEMFRTVIESGKEALNSALLINGGAVVVILGFLGASVGKGASTSLALTLTLPLLFFGGGVLFASVALAARYITQFFYSMEIMRAGGCFHILAVLLGIASYLSFGVAVYRSYAAFGLHFAAAA